MAKVTLRFYGSLAEHGERFDVFASTAREALYTVVSQLDGVKEKIVNNFYRLRVAKHDVTERDLQSVISSELKDGDVIHVVPKAVGGGGALNFIAGAALIAFSFTNPLGWAALAVGSTTVGTIAFGVGVSLILGGVANLLVKQPKMTTGAGEETAKNYGFNNLANNTVQGSAIPICYGNITIGAGVISQGIRSERLNSVPTSGEVNAQRKTIALVKARDKQGTQYNTEQNDKTYILVEE